MRNFILVFFCCAGLLTATESPAQDFRVQAAAFAKPVDLSYFQDRGVENVFSSYDQNGIYRYFVGAYETREQAEVVQQQLIAKGFLYAAIIDLEEQRALYGAQCPYFRDQQIFVTERNIFFELGKSDLSTEAKAELDEVARLLAQDPASKLNLHGYTDNIGDAKSNAELATARARAARDYLMTKGIKAERIFIKIFGEAEPGMEHRDLDNNDIEANRKWNRRVALIILDANGQVK